MPRTPPARADALQVTMGAHTDVGRRRSVNEDSLLAAFPVFIVADGMGGHDAGDRASAAVVDAFRPLVGRDDLTADDVARAVGDAHTAVTAIAAHTQRGAGSTLTGVIAVHHGGVRRWLALNVGDSRVYRLLSDRLEQVTTDHSLVQELVDRGSLRREEMSTYEGRNVITRAMGEERSAADYWLLPVVTGERLLVCSDGLSTELVDEAIRAGMILGGSPTQTAQTLVEQAVAHGGRDNVTAIVLDVIGGGVSASSDDATGSLMTTEDSSTIEVATLASSRQRSPRG